MMKQWFMFTRQKKKKKPPKQHRRSNSKVEPVSTRGQKHQSCRNKNEIAKKGVKKTARRKRLTQRMASLCKTTTGHKKKGHESGAKEKRKTRGGLPQHGKRGYRQKKKKTYKYFVDLAQISFWIIYLFILN